MRASAGCIMTSQAFRCMHSALLLFITNTKICLLSLWALLHVIRKGMIACTKISSHKTRLSDQTPMFQRTDPLTLLFMQSYQNCSLLFPWTPYPLSNEIDFFYYQNNSTEPRTTLLNQPRWLYSILLTPLKNVYSSHTSVWAYVRNSKPIYFQPFSHAKLDVLNVKEKLFFQGNIHLR